MVEVSTETELWLRFVAADETQLTIGTVAARTGIAVSAVRFYENNGLIESVRTASGHRRFPRSVLRRLSVIVVCQRLGYSLSEIRVRLDVLPDDAVPDTADWSRLAADFRSEIDERIERLLSLRDHLDGCIGCGCLSLDVCMLFNPDDAAASLGTGPRYLLGDTSADLPRHQEIPVPDSTEWHLAQVNIGRLHHPVDDPRSAEFMENLDPINALAEAAPGFVWRLQDDSGNATAIRAFDDDTILPNLSVWESIDALKAYVFKSDHARFLRRRRQWFQPMDDLPVLTMWWVPAGHRPDMDEAKSRIDHLRDHGPTPTAFTFHPTFPPG